MLPGRKNVGGEIPGGKIPMITVYLTRHLEPASGVINSPLSRLDSSAREPGSSHCSYTESPTRPKFCLTTEHIRKHCCWPPRTLSVPSIALSKACLDGWVGAREPLYGQRLELHKQSLAPVWPSKMPRLGHMACLRLTDDIGVCGFERGRAKPTLRLMWTVPERAARATAGPSLTMPAITSMVIANSTHASFRLAR